MRSKKLNVVLFISLLTGACVLPVQNPESPKPSASVAVSSVKPSVTSVSPSVTVSAMPTPVGSGIVTQQSGTPTNNIPTPAPFSPDPKNVITEFTPEYCQQGYDYRCPTPNPGAGAYSINNPIDYEFRNGNVKLLFLEMSSRSVITEKLKNSTL